jgi:hypothetical protein
VPDVRKQAGENRTTATLPEMAASILPPEKKNNDETE